MIGRRIYMDYNATAPLRPVARQAAYSALETLGNPSSIHAEGRSARRLVEEAREHIARLANTTASNVVFTSGATEANNWVLGADWKTIFVPLIEHESVLAVARAAMQRGVQVVALPSSRRGETDVTQVADYWLRGHASAEPALVAIQLANNETGVLQPVRETASFCRQHGLAVHVDGVQGAGRMAIEFDELGVDTLSLSSHKIGGPMGVGALIMREDCRLSPLMIGGGQERRRRAGTENVPGIAGFGAAAEEALAEVGRMSSLASLRDRLERGVKQVTPAAEFIASNAERLANTSAIAVPGISSETLLIKLDLAGVAVSTGSACSSGKVGSSHVLTAMEVPTDIARGAIRISLGWQTSADDITAFLEVWKEIAVQRKRAAA
ncbi:MAG: cysteine desulfurase family protein [Hyphomicrobiaceae bacterium]